MRRLNFRYAKKVCETLGQVSKCSSIGHIANKGPVPTKYWCFIDNFLLVKIGDYIP